MKPNHLRPRALVEMASNRVTHHRPKFLQSIALCDNRMSERSGYITPVDFILVDLEDNFAHAGN